MLQVKSLGQISSWMEDGVLSRFVIVRHSCYLSWTNLLFVVVDQFGTALLLTNSAFVVLDQFGNVFVIFFVFNLIYFVALALFFKSRGVANMSEDV